MNLNDQARVLADDLIAQADALCVQRHDTAGARVVDCGVHVPGSAEAGRYMARIALADLARVERTEKEVRVFSARPILACLASQYAGWKIDPPGYFAMASGPMRVRRGGEKILEYVHEREESDGAVGLLEATTLPTEQVVDWIAERLRIAPVGLTLLVAPAASIAGTIQIVARGLETALHKLHELNFDVCGIREGRSIVPIPPVGRSEISAIGHANDAILYGGRVTLTVDADDDLIAAIGPRVPSSASADHGVPFAELFRRHGGNFYRIDPMLFSPAVIEFRNERTGREHVFGELRTDILDKSWASCNS